MEEPIIQVRDLAKCYRLGEIGATTLRDEVERLYHIVRGQREKIRQSGEFWALKGLNFEVRQGEVLGIIGRNGAGKSTILKLLSRITEPTEGKIVLNGRVASLLEVGTGMHPELTGRENIYLNGTILGMTKREIDAKLGEIISFSGIKNHIDTPVKRYSSGMKVRLAFAVAAHLEPEILIVDEVLAVGDAEFQKRCIGKIKDVAGHGRTVLFVSHQMGSVLDLCSRCLWIEQGRLKEEGDPASVVNNYLTHWKTANAETLQLRARKHDLTINSVELLDAESEPASAFKCGEPLKVRVNYTAGERLELPKFIISVHARLGPCFTASMVLDGHCPQRIEGQGALEVTFPSLPLVVRQEYMVTVGAYTQEDTELFPPTEVGGFSTIGDLADYGMYGKARRGFLNESVSVVVPYQWTLPDGTTEDVPGFLGRGGNVRV